jgi:hypothetical protein
MARMTRAITNLRSSKTIGARKSSDPVRCEYLAHAISEHLIERLRFGQWGKRHTDAYS